MTTVNFPVNKFYLERIPLASIIVSRTWKLRFILGRSFIILGRSFTAGLRINLVNKYKQDNLPFTNTYLVLNHHFPQFSKKQLYFSRACSLSTRDICRHVAQGRSNCTTYVIAEFIQMKIWTGCKGVEVVTISEIYYLGYFQVKYNINNIAEAFL